MILTTQSDCPSKGQLPNISLLGSWHRESWMDVAEQNVKKYLKFDEKLFRQSKNHFLAKPFGAGSSSRGPCSIS